MTNREPTKWYRMDNSGMIYPIIGTLSTQSNFRLQFRLREAIDSNLLREALFRTYDRYPYYRVAVERGIFRHYLAENTREPRVWPSDGVLLGRTAFAQNDYFPIRVSYWADSVFITVFHGLTDGHGGMQFACYLLTTYLSLSAAARGETMPEAADFFPQKEGETENAYDAYYTRQPFFKGLRDTSGGHAAQVKGTFFVRDGLACTHGAIGVREALAVARAKGCSLTELMAAAALLAAVRTRAVCRASREPKVFIPINLRKLFPSNTMFNFVGIIKCTVPAATATLEDYIALIRQQMAEQNQRESFLPKLAFSSLFSKNPLLRVFPLSLKMFFSKVGRALAKSTKQTMICSNLGIAPLPPEVAKEVQDFSFALNANRRTPQNMAMVTFGDTLSVTWSRHIVEKDIDCEFYRIMRELGLDMRVSSNYREVDHAL